MRPTQNPAAVVTTLSQHVKHSVVMYQRSKGSNDVSTRPVRHVQSYVHSTDRRVSRGCRTGETPACSPSFCCTCTTYAVKNRTMTPRARALFSYARLARCLKQRSKKTYYGKENSQSSSNNQSAQGNLQCTQRSGLLRSQAYASGRPKPSTF